MARVLYAGEPTEWVLERVPRTKQPLLPEAPFISSLMSRAHSGSRQGFLFFFCSPNVSWSIPNWLSHPESGKKIIKAQVEQLVLSSGLLRS